MQIYEANWKSTFKENSKIKQWHPIVIKSENCELSVRLHFDDIFVGVADEIYRDSNFERWSEYKDKIGGMIKSHLLAEYAMTLFKYDRGRL